MKKLRQTHSENVSPLGHNASEEDALLAVAEDISADASAEAELGRVLAKIAAIFLEFPGAERQEKQG